MKRKTQNEKDLEYFEKMKNTITNDLLNGRNISAIQGSINRYGEWWKNKLETYNQELSEDCWEIDKGNLEMAFKGTRLEGDLHLINNK